MLKKVRLNLPPFFSTSHGYYAATGYGRERDYSEEIVFGASSGIRDLRFLQTV